MKKIYYLIHSISFGDTLAATPTLRYLSNSHGKKINVVSHQPHIFKNNPYVETCINFDEFYTINPLEIIKYESFTFAGRIDNNGVEKKFSHIDTRQLHAMDLGFQLLPDQMEYDYYPDNVDLPYDIPERYVVCHITQNWSNRTWDTEKWQNLINWLSDNKIFTILIGKDHSEIVHSSISVDPINKVCPKLDNLYGLNLCNEIGLEQMFKVIKNSEVLITMDTGPLHIAGATDTHILQIGSAQHPLLRIPYRKGTQAYKYTFVGGTCSLFCNTDLKYNVREWGHINAVAPLTECSENKTTFECHPSHEKVIHELSKILELNSENRYLDFFELLPKNENDSINFNFTKTTDDDVTIVVKDVSTGLIRDKYQSKCRRVDNAHFWWTPMPGKIDNLGDIDLYFYLNDEFYGKKRLYYSGNQKLLINNNEYDFSYMNGFDYPTFWEVFIKNEYEKKDMVKVEKNDVVLDIGANKGFFTLKSLKNLASKVYSVEPVKETFEQLKVISNKFSNVTFINKAVGKNDGIIEMFVDSESTATNCVVEYGEMFHRSTNKVSVESININTLIDNIGEKINLMKVDCEGSELDVFTTITDSNLNNIDKIIVETHGEKINEIVTNRLLNSNFDVHQYGDILFAEKKLK